MVGGRSIPSGSMQRSMARRTPNRTESSMPDTHTALFPTTQRSAREREIQSVQHFLLVGDTEVKPKDKSENSMETDIIGDAPRRK